MAARVYEKTLEEKSKGFLRGPFTPEQLEQKHGPGWVASPRSGVDQHGDVRCIDDLSIFGVNACAASEHKVDLGGVDEPTALGRAYLEAVQPDGTVVVRLRSGVVLRGKLPPGVTREDVLKLAGKCVDLKSAYRQIARAPAQARFAIIAVFNPESGATEYYEMLAMPFGSRAAVYCFNEVARGLQYILLDLFGIVCSNYYDDFPILEPEATATDAAQVAIEVLSLLGWLVKPETAEAEVLPAFDALGVHLDFTAMPSGEFAVGNKATRVVALRAEVALARTKQRLPQREVEGLKGRLRYATGWTFGRCGGLAFRLLSEHGRSRCLWSDWADLALAWYDAFLVAAVPRVLRLVAPFGHPVLFTDAACEDGGAL